MDLTVNIVVLVTFEPPVQKKARTLTRYQNDGVTMFSITRRII